MMKFFSINNELCAKCVQCERKCPVNAISHRNNRVEIDYEKCIACGICFKICPDSAIEINIPIEEIAKVKVYQQQNKNLEHRLNVVHEENRVLTEKLFLLTERFRAILNKLPYGVVICDHSKVITFSNDTFIEYLDYDTRLLAEGKNGLIGIDISNILSDSIDNYIESSLYGGEDCLNKSVVIGNRRLFVSTYSVSKTNYVFAIFRNTYNDEILKDEISLRIQEVIDQNMAMIQKIGFLMGEETSKNTKNLNSIISSLK